LPAGAEAGQQRRGYLRQQRQYRPRQQPDEEDACGGQRPAAICALPPLNGFVSEFIIYTGMFRSIAEGQQVLLAAAGVTALALIGGLACLRRRRAAI